jgi:hypothetical protein
MTWEAVPSGRRGRQQAYSDAAIQACLTFKVLFGLPLRQTTGFVASLLKLVGLDWTAPDFSTLCRHQKTVSVAIPYKGSTEPLHLLVPSHGLQANHERAADSTGIKAEGKGEWNARKAPLSGIATQYPAGQRVGLNGGRGARYILGSMRKRWRYGQSPAGQWTLLRCLTCSTKSHQSRSSAASRLTEHTAHANATMRLRPGMPMPSSHPERMPSYGSPIHPEPEHATKPSDPQSIWAAHCSDRSPDITAEAASKRTLSWVASKPLPGSGCIV